MNRNICLLAAVLLLAVASACSGGGSAPANSGLTPLDFDVTTDATSTVGADDVIGYAVERTNPMFAAAETKVPAGYELAALLKFEPETAEDAGFSGDFTVRTQDRSVSAVGDSWGELNQVIWDSRSQVLSSFRSGFYSKSGGGSFHFHLDFLGIVMLLRPTGSQFQVAAFADLATAPVNTDVNFWVLQRNGVEPVTYHWDFGDGTSAEGAEVSHSYPLINDYNVTITATDGAGNVAPVASTPISITGNPVPLTEVDVVVTPPIIQGGAVALSATVNGGTAPFEYEWDTDGDGDIDDTSGAHITVVPPSAGTYVFELTVTDQTGAEATTSGVIDARRVNVLVTLDGTASSGQDHEGYAPDVAHITVETEGTDSFDTITVDFGDGSSDTYVGPVDHAYPTGGTYRIQATLTRSISGHGAVSLQSDPVFITIDPRPAPVIESVTPARGAVGTEVTLVGNFFFLPEVDDEVLLGQVPMPVITWEPRMIVVTVPQGARDGDITVRKALGDLVSNPMPFDVAPTPPGQPGTGQL